ncbi:MAG: metallophosphoesterase family protein, partial [Firmicutes bacterium]|nr:metallophosphoesterase family protein [Bacillota bacterium]
GHTHRALNADADGLRLINPGSITLPADGSRGTYAILTIEDGEFSAEIVEIEKSETASGNNTSGGNSAPSKSKSKVQGGFIRDLLNNSDRF